jgi:hypothetical protein
MKDKKQMACSFFKQDRKQSEIAEVLSVGAGRVSRWVRSLKSKQDNERDQKVLQMWLACRPYDEIVRPPALLTDQGQRSSLLGYVPSNV